MPIARPWVACASFALACSSSAPDLRGPSHDDPPPAEAEPVPCSEGTYRTETGACEAFAELSVARSPHAIEPGRDHHTTMVVETTSGPYLYVFGGTDNWQAIHDDVQRAPIDAAGNLGPFEPIAMLPSPRAGHCTIRIGDRLIFAGGILAGRPSATTVTARLAEDGSLEDFAAGPKLPKAVMHLSCETRENVVYVFGGRGTDSQSTDLSAHATLAPDGSLSDFVPDTPLVPDRSHHASFVRGRRIYLVGGLRGDPTRKPEDRSDIVVADIDDTGALGAWQPAGALPAAISVSSALLHRDAVYVFGGLEGGARFTDKIRRATFEGDGSVSPFVTLEARLPEPRGHVHQTPTWGDRIYSVGGKSNEGRSVGEVDVGRFE
jgi:hypothetical protein